MNSHANLYVILIVLKDIRAASSFIPFSMIFDYFGMLLKTLSMLFWYLNFAANFNPSFFLLVYRERENLKITYRKKIYWKFNQTYKFGQKMAFLEQKMLMSAFFLFFFFFCVFSKLYIVFHICAKFYVNLMRARVIPPLTVSRT